VVDVSDWDAMSSYATAVVEEFGRVELVFCVAGIIHTGDLVASDPADVERVLAVNVMGVVHTAKLFLPHLIAAGPGRLVMVSSGFGLMAAPYYSAYSASKFAVRALADSVRQEMALAGHRVVVTCVYPGGVRTPIMRNGRYATGVSRDAVVDGFDRRMARTTPEDAATVILRGVARGRPRVLVGRDAVAVSAFVHAAGATYPGLLARGARAARLLSGFRTHGGA
jgi:NAD(P)-dependent dehydrogenase (short-subunit alcohol dehydrogenase family)